MAEKCKQTKANWLYFGSAVFTVECDCIASAVYGNVYVVLYHMGILYYLQLTLKHER